MIPAETFAAIQRGLKALRIRLGETQESMARRIGCTVRGYQRWEAGGAEPSAEYLIRILSMCPDRESLKAFGLGSDILNLQSELGRCADLRGVLKAIMDSLSLKDLWARLAKFVEDSYLKVETARAAKLGSGKAGKHGFGT